MISRMVARLDSRPDLAEVGLAGELRLATASDVRNVLLKLLVAHPNVLVDLSGLRLAWKPGVQVFPTVLAATDGWPTNRMVLFGADATMAAALDLLYVTATVPLTRDRASAERRLQTRPDTVRRRLQVQPVATAPSRAREFVSTACRDWSIPAAIPAATLVVNELVTNAVIHAGTVADVDVRLNPRGLWIEVNDYRVGSRPPRPVPRLVGGTGRGLHLVAALSTNLGSTARPDGTSVWALLDTSGT